MKSTSLIVFATFLFQVTSAMPVVAQSRQEAYTVVTSTKCIGAIHQVHSNIENRLGGAVCEISYFDPSRQYPDSPNEKATQGFCHQFNSDRCR